MNLVKTHTLSFLFLFAKICFGIFSPDVPTFRPTCSEFVREYVSCVCVVAAQGPSGVCPGGGVIRHRLLGHGELGRRMGRHHSGTLESAVLCLQCFRVVEAQDRS